MLTLWNGVPRRRLHPYTRSLVTPAAPRRAPGPNTTVVEEEGGLTLRSEVPGYGPENLDVTFEDGVLTLRGTQRVEIPSEEGEEGPVSEERTVFTRSFRLPEQVNEEAIEAKLKYGVLTVTLPFAEKPAPRSIDIALG